MKPRPNEDFEQFLARFVKSSEPIVKEVTRRKRFTSNTERKRRKKAKARQRWERRRRWLAYVSWRSDKFDDMKGRNG